MLDEILAERRPRGGAWVRMMRINDGLFIQGL
jgi:hypothetical protein